MNFLSTSKARYGLAGLFLLLTLVVMLVACGDSATPTPVSVTIPAPTTKASATTSAATTATKITSVAGSFVGTVPGTDAYIAVVTNGSKVMAYICDGALYAEWFEGSTSGDGKQIDLMNYSGINLKATISLQSVSGTIIVGPGVEYKLVAEPAKGAGGLYKVDNTEDGQPGRQGLVRLNNGDFRGRNYPPFIRIISPSPSLLQGKVDPANL